jgi:lipopolysaccharide export system permease protein
MKKLQAYAIAEFLPPFVLSVAVFTFVMLLDKLLDLLDMIVSKGIPIRTVIEIFVLLLPSMIAVVVPMGVLAAVLIAFGRMAGDLEITAMKASGIGVMTTMTPVLVLAALMAGALIFFGNSILPDANHMARNLLLDIGTLKPSAKIVPGMFVDEIEGYVIYVEAKDDLTGELTGVYIEQSGSDAPARIITAMNGRLEPLSANRMRLLLTEGQMHELTQDNEYRTLDFDNYVLEIDRSEDLVRRERENRGDREMSASLMRSTADSLAMEVAVLSDSIVILGRAPLLAVARGESIIPATDADSGSSGDGPRALYNRARNEIQMTASELRILSDRAASSTRTMNKLRVEIHKKFSIPVACIVFVLLGVPLGLSLRQGSAGVSLGVSLLFILLYYLFLLGGEQLADRGIMPGWLAMWLPNILLGALGIHLTFRSIREGNPVTLPDLKPLARRLGLLRED